MQIPAPPPCWDQRAHICTYMHQHTRRRKTMICPNLNNKGADDISSFSDFGHRVWAKNGQSHDESIGNSRFGIPHNVSRAKEGRRMAL